MSSDVVVNKLNDGVIEDLADELSKQRRRTAKAEAQLAAMSEAVKVTKCDYLVMPVYRELAADMINATKRCKVCGCTDDNPCMSTSGPCWWVTDELCSSCVPEGGLRHVH